MSKTGTRKVDGMLVDQSTISACPPHYFKLESPQGGPTVPGTCRRCGATKEFPSSWDGPTDFQHAPMPGEVHHFRLEDLGFHLTDGEEGSS